ncbi:DUF4328 domain-containing protein [Croceitalea vernalis]|uniref:DUF4328 domain-containing protein n=1 Tax=Croceitalea vernalis TaxID=3075599 RepID=A0ABU3BEQ4_9FLAO|nr:DUF4328 domain-containing protein [Croceitalea sp. P007]MDT0620634.1 DUF4328 domain-containing protein [Croceitalea sp. P007]
MTRQERLVFCKKCENRYLDLQKGLLCKLTEKEADFEGECADFKEDLQKKYILKPKKPIRPNAKRAKWAEYSLWAILVIGIISFISSYLQYDLLLKVQEGFVVSDPELEDNDLREGIVGITYSVLFIISAITYIRWFRRAYYNLHSRTLTPLYDEGWAAGAWFIPILNLFRPYKIMMEIDEETSTLIEKRKENTIKRTGGLIGAWWALWIISGMVDRYAFKLGWRAETLDEFLTSTQAEMVGMLVEFPLVILAILVVRKISDKEIFLSKLELQKSLTVS